MSALGKLGSADLAANTDTLLATMDEAGIIAVRFANRTAGQVKLRIAIGPNGGVAPAAADYILYDATCEANMPASYTNLSVSSGEKVWVRSDTANVSARADGVPST